MVSRARLFNPPPSFSSPRAPVFHAVVDCGSSEIAKIKPPSLGCLARMRSSRAVLRRSIWRRGCADLVAEAPHRLGRPLVDRVRLRRQLRPAHPARPAVAQSHPLVTGSPIHAATVRGPAARWRTLGQLGALLPPASVDERDLKSSHCHRGHRAVSRSSDGVPGPVDQAGLAGLPGGCITDVAPAGDHGDPDPPAPAAPRPAGIGHFRQFRRELD